MKKYTKKELEKIFLEKYSTEEILNLEEKQCFNNEIKNIIGEIHNTKINAIKPLTAIETYVLRAIYGVNENRCCTTKSNIANELKLTCEMVRQIYTRAHNLLNKRIENSFKLKSNFPDAMSSIDYYDNFNNLKEISIGEIGFSLQSRISLILCGIYTLGDLLKYSEHDIKYFFGINNVTNIKQKLKQKEICLIEDLSIAQRKEIISMATEDKKFNSSIDWISRTGKVSTKLHSEYGLTNIYDLQAFIFKYPNKISLDIINYANNLGFNLKMSIDEQLKNKYKDQQKEVRDLEQISILSLGFSRRTRNCLMRAHICDLQNLLNNGVSGLRQIKNIGEMCYREIVDKVYSMALYFCDEVPSDDKRIEEIITRRDNLFDRYSKVLKQKETLIEENKELDKEIKEVMSQFNFSISGEKNGKVKK